MRRFAVCLIAVLVVILFAGSSTGDVIVSRPVSVAAGNLRVDGTIFSAPVSVTVNGSLNQDGAVLSLPVSVAYEGFEAIAGSITSKPVSVTLNQFLGLWSMENNWLDSSGNGNNGTASGSPTFVEGKTGSAGSFNGTSSYLDMGISETLRPIYTVSIEAWIKPSTLSSAMYIAGNSDEATLKGYSLSLTSSGKLEMKFGNGAWQSVTGSTAVTPGLWYHIVGTFDGKKLKLYVNGMPDGEVSASGVITYANTGTFRVGYHPGASGPGYYAGLIDELAVFGRPLSETEVMAHYQAGKIDLTLPLPPSVDPVPQITSNGTILLSGGKEPNTSIWIGNTMVVELNSAGTWQASVNLAYGVNTLKVTAVDASDNQSPPTTVSITMDNKAPVIIASIPPNNYSGVVPVSSVTISLSDDYSDIDLSASVAGATVKNGSGGRVSGTWIASGQNTVVFIPSSGPLPPDTYVVTVNTADALDNRGTGQITFANRDTLAPVTTISAQGTLRLDGWYSSDVTVSLSASDDAQGAGLDYSEYSFDGNSWIRYAAPFTLSTDGIITLYYRSKDRAGNIEQTKQQEFRINKSGIIGQWHMDNDWLDSSILKNNGTAFKHAGFSEEAKIGSHSGAFDGIDDYVRASLDGTGFTGLSIEMWIMRRATESKGVFQWANAIASPWPFIYFWDDRGTLKMYSNAAYWATTPIELNKWHHIALTYTGTVWTFYKDGNPVSSITAGKTYQPNAAGVYFGNGYHGYWNGLMDEVTIFNKALSAEEIKAHYDSFSVTPPSVDPVTSPVSTPSITLSGTKEVNTSIRVGGIEIVPVDDQTTWQAIYTIQPGMNSLNITAVDSRGYASQPVTVSVALDIVAPGIVSSTPAHNAAISTPVTAVTVVLSDEFSAVDLQQTINGATAFGPAGQEIQGTWSQSDTNTVVFTPVSAFPEGASTVTIRPTDTLGNRGTATIGFTCDTQGPPPPSLNLVSTPTNRSYQTISGTMSGDAIAVVISSSTASSGTVTYSGGKTWSAVVSGLMEGANLISVVAKDAAGNQSSAVTTTIVYDSVPPSAPTVVPVESPTRVSTQTLSGTKEPDTAIYINGIQRVPLDAQTSWNHHYSMSEGSNSLRITARDAAGNDSTPVSVSITVDTAGPLFTVDTFQNPANVPNQTISGKKEAGCRVTLNGVQIYGLDDLNETWSQPLTLSVGTNHFSFSATDALGNSTAKAIDILYDNSGPQITSFSLTDGQVIVTPITITSSAEDHESGMAKLELSVDGTLAGVQTGSTISYLWDTTGVADGTHAVQVKAYDKAGNSSESSRQVVVNLGRIIDLGDVKAASIDGDYLYTSHGTGNPSLRVFSLSDPLNPAPLGTYNGGTVNTFSAGGSSGVGLSGGSGLLSMNFDGAAFTKTSEITLPWSSVKSLSLMGPYAFYASGQDGWGMVELSQGSELHDMGVVPTGSPVNKVTLGGGYLYAANGAGGLGIYKFDSLIQGNPVVTITAPVSGTNVYAGAQLDVTAEVTDGDGAVVVFMVNGKEQFTDMSAPYRYRLVAPGAATTLVLKARAYNIAGTYSDSQEIEVNVTERTVLSVSIGPKSSGGDTGGPQNRSTDSSDQVDQQDSYTQALDVIGNMAVTGDKRGYLTFFEISDPLHPVKLSSLFTGNDEIRRVKIAGQRVFATTAGVSTIMVDFSAPENPRVVSTIDLYGSQSGVDSYNNIVFIGRDDTPVFLFDVTAEKEYSGIPQSTNLGLSYISSGPGWIRDLRAERSSQRLYVLVDDGHASALNVYDTGTITSVRNIEKVPLPADAGPRRMRVDGDRAYIAASDGIIIVDLAGLGKTGTATYKNGSGRLLNYVKGIGDASDLEVNGNTLIVAGGPLKWLRFFDIAIPASPAEVGKMTTSGDALEIRSVGEFLYIAEGFKGLRAVRFVK